MEEFKYQFKTIDDKEKISGSKIFNIIDGFPSDYSEQAVLIYGKLKTLFGEPLYEEKDVESREAAHQLLEMIQQADPTDYDYVGYYLDGPSRIQEGIKNGVPYHEEVELDDLSEEEMDAIFREVMGEE